MQEAVNRGELGHRESARGSRSRRKEKKAESYVCSHYRTSWNAMSGNEDEHWGFDARGRKEKKADSYVNAHYRYDWDSMSGNMDAVRAATGDGDKEGKAGQRGWQARYKKGSSNRSSSSRKGRTDRGMSNFIVPGDRRSIVHSGNSSRSHHMGAKSCGGCCGWLARTQRLGHASTEAPDLTLWTKAHHGKAFRYRDLSLKDCVINMLGVLLLILVPIAGANIFFLLPLARHDTDFWSNYMYHFVMAPVSPPPPQLDWSHTPHSG